MANSSLAQNVSHRVLLAGMFGFHVSDLEWYEGRKEGVALPQAA